MTYTDVTLGIIATAQAGTCDVPPTDTDARLEAAVTLIDQIRTDINAVIRDMPDDAPMFVIVDIVNALWSLRNASVCLDKALDALDVEAVR